MEDKIAVKIQNLNKSFIVPSEKRDRLKSRFLNIFRPIKKAKIEILKDLNLEIHKGEFISIIGRNGSGKSTLLKLIAGIYAPNSGTIETSGTIIPFLELGVGFNPELSAKDNIFLNGTILGMSRKYLEEKFDEILAFSEIGEFINVPIKNFSSGMQVRLAFSIAMQAKGDIYILDEVLAVGDKDFQEKSIRAIKQLKAKGKTILYVSHNMESVREHSDKVLLIDSGKKIIYGFPDEAEIAYNKIILEHQNIVAKHQISQSPIKKESPFRIRGLSILNNKKKQISIIPYKQDFNIQIEIEKLSEPQTKGLNAGLGIYSVDGEYIFGVNTAMDGIKVDTKTNKITLSIQNPKLLNGKYYINTVLFGKDEMNPYHFVRQTLFFQITKAPKYRGNIEIEHKWLTQ